MLLDPEGNLGRLYGARTTPHMYIVDPAGTLVYMGAIDDQPTANPASVKVARNYVREALDGLAPGPAHRRSLDAAVRVLGEILM